MAFRADEAADIGFARARRLLVHRLPPDERDAADETLRRVVEVCGPAVDAYPSWHPLVSNHDERQPEIVPNKRCGYEGLDHTAYFAHGFVTCPYGDGEVVIEAVGRLPHDPIAEIVAERLDAPFYNSGTTAVLVRCEWSRPLDPGYMVPKAIAVPLMLEKEVGMWRWSERGETWDTMRPYLLGEPYGSRSSLFVSQDTAMALKKIFTAMGDSGMFGPVKPRNARRTN